MIELEYLGSWLEILKSLEGMRSNFNFYELAGGATLVHPLYWSTVSHETENCSASPQIEAQTVTRNRSQIQGGRSKPRVCLNSCDKSQ